MSGNKTKRRIRHEGDMFRSVMAAVFRAKTMEELEALVVGSVVEDPHWRDLPAFRRARVDAYMQGALDALARVYVKASHDGARQAAAPARAKSPLRAWL